jgi:ABC-type dipeptide/oligopeptide/nickel transport system permease subunit
VSAAPVTAATRVPASHQSFWARAWRKYRRNKFAVVGLVFVALLLVVGLLGPMLAPYPYAAVDYNATWQGPSAAHWFGTDELGRDLFSRLLYSLRNAIIIALGAEAITLFFGCTVGAVAGYMGGRVDNLIMRFTDIMFAFPSLLFNVVLVAVLGRGMVTIFIAIGATSWVGMARLVRGQILSLKGQEYVEAARAAGASHTDIIFRYLLPNTMGAILVTIGMGIPRAMMVESSLSVIGMGVQPPMPSWGNLITVGLPFLRSQPHLLLFPALSFALTLLAFTYVADGMRDALDSHD